MGFSVMGRLHHETQVRKYILTGKEAVGAAVDQIEPLAYIFAINMVTLMLMLISLL